MGSVSPESMSSPDSRSARSPFDGDRGGAVAEDQLGERLDVFQRCPHEVNPPAVARLATTSGSPKMDTGLATHTPSAS